jgi:RNA polymerase sigma factor (TIGR02999 family)
MIRLASVSDVTRILSQMEQGDPQAADKLLPLVYDELRKLAAVKLAQEQPGQTLQATALVHDAYIRLVDHQHSQHWDNRGHFFVAAAEAMRRILVDSARRRQSLKGGGGLEHQSLDELAIAGPEPDDRVVAVSEALEQLSATDKTAAELVKLRYFAGLNGKDAAAALGLAERSADRLWVYARSWLLKHLTDP